jgi:pre-rRNA-processing protein TSR4
MWTGGDDLSEDGKPVRIYQPILYGRKPRLDDVTCSYVGGPQAATSSTGSCVCPSCQEPLHPLVQLHNTSNQRTLQVLACNRASCIRGLFPGQEDDNSAGRNVLHYGGGGVVVCRRLAVVNPTSGTTSPAAAPRVDDPPNNEVVVPSNSNEWAVQEDDDNSNCASAELDDLESKLAAMETRAKGPTKLVTKEGSPASKHTATTKTSGFPSFELHSLQEPPALRSGGEFMDDDDVGIGSGRGADDRKIHQMLAKYLAEEDDPDILAALRGAGNGSNGSGKAGSGGERDERLSATDRALLTFADRLKRAPRQVLRYALGGVPLWSV